MKPLVFILPLLALTFSLGCGQVNNSEEIGPGKANIEIYGSINETEDDNHYIRLLGEVINNGSQDAVDVEILFSFKNKLQGIIGSKSVKIIGATKTLVLSDMETNTVLSPDDKSGFELETSITWEDVDDYEYNIRWEEQQLKTPWAKVILVEGSIIEFGNPNSGGLLELSGSLKNIGNETATEVKIIFILRNSRGKVIDVSPPAALSNIAPDQTKSFTASGILVPPDGVADYYYKISWQDYKTK